MGRVIALGSWARGRAGACLPLCRRWRGCGCPARTGLMLFLAAALHAAPARAQVADTVRVAVAANFAAVQEELALRFTAETGVVVVASVGSTGQLYAQVKHGAPFDVFLAADDERPHRLEAEGWAVPGTRFTYAEGRLALYGPGLDSVRAGGVELRSGRFAHLAIADPETAPYGAAAVQALARLGLRDPVETRIVRGGSIGQTFRFVRSGAAELGFVALSQVIDEPRRAYWLVPPALHEPIVQDAVLLKHGANNPAARRYLAFIRSAEACARIEAYGYGARR